MASQKVRTLLLLRFFEVLTYNMYAFTIKNHNA